MEEVFTDGASGSQSEAEIPLFTLPTARQRDVLSACHPEIKNMLDYDQIFPYLNKHHLLTASDQEELDTMARRGQKIDWVVKALPRKGSDALWKFMDCLRQTADGTAHGELVSLLKEQVDEEVKRSQTAVIGSRNLVRMKSVWLLLIIASLLLVSLLLVVYLGGYTHVLIEKLYYRYNLHHSKSLPPLRTNFVGRKQDIKTIVDLLAFSNDKNRIVSIYGPPGFGKSALAIHVGHSMVSQGAVVYYVNMDEVSSVQALAEKILTNDVCIVSLRSISTDRLERWARELQHNTLLILDNCDSVIQRKGGGDSEKEMLQNNLTKLLESTSSLKVLMTSRKYVVQFDLRQHRIQELSPDSACNLLQSEVGQLDLGMECSTIANLTGNVPLALKVVGTLLSQPDSPDPATIIAELQAHLISTLSPEELPLKEQVNASIAISYEYLSKPQRKVGRYLANFPGSFSGRDSCEIFAHVFRNCDRSCTMQALGSLVGRSLIEHNTHTNRYHFHQLIKEFFLAVQTSIGEQGRKERSRFAHSFHRHYGGLLYQLAKDFSNNHIAVLKVVDAERHNLQFFLQHFTSATCGESRSLCLQLFPPVHLALKQGLLQSRFTMQELYGPVDSIVRYLDINARNRISSASHVELYVFFLKVLAEFESKQHGIEKAVQILEHRRDNIEFLDRELPGKGAAVPYTTFYAALSDYYTMLQVDAKVLDCDTRILRKTEELQDCDPGSCSYCDIGSAYYRINKYVKAIYFLNNCLQLRMTYVVRAIFLDHLIQSYKELGDYVNVQATEEKFVDLFSNLMEESAVEFQRKPAHVHQIISVYATLGRWKEVVALKEKHLKAAKELGREVSITDVMNALELTRLLYKNSSFEDAADMGEFTLRSLKQIPEETRNKLVSRWLEITYLVAMAKYRIGNYSESEEYFTDIVDFVYDQYIHNGTLVGTSISIIGSCFRIPVQKLKECSRLFYDGITTVIKYLAFGYMHIATQVALEVEPSDADHHESETVVTTATSVSFSHSLAIRTPPDIGLSLLSHLPLQLLESIKINFKMLILIMWNCLLSFWSSLLSYTFVRRCINFCWVFLKVWIPIHIFIQCQLRAFVYVICKIYNFLYLLYILVCTLLGF